MAENHVIISQSFHTLLGAFAPYIGSELLNEFGKDWWDQAVLDVLYDDQKRDLPSSGNNAKLLNSLDIQRCLVLFDLHWQRVFRKKLSVDHRTWAKELVGVRNRLAHIGGDDFSDDDTWRALDTMSRLCEQINNEKAEEIRALLRKIRYGTENGSTSVTETFAAVSGKSKVTGILNSVPVAGLPAWRNVIEPHPDVAQGRYKNAEFAADLAQVTRGEGSFEYRDPVEFFSRTFITEGIAGLLEQSLRRVCGKDGEPVIQLKTAFGGGKTHSMLALYHVMRGHVSAEKIPGIMPILQRAGVSALPKTNVAVLVGTALSPAKSRRPNNMPGITINTLWGEMAAQLADSAGKPNLYDYVKEADKKGVSPGSEAIKSLFNACSPCLVLMDELVNYAKKLYGAKDLPAGTFDNFIAFIQEVTEAARASRNSLVVASIPESEIEIGGDAGKTALETIEHTFGRMESIWKPVAANEGFEVVRRRLFLNCKNPDGRDAVCAKFSQMYAENQSDFPIESKELEYNRRMVSCYPIHPEIFDRLYEDWATLERFQRTRGVLRLMAAVIHELWMANDESLMIMPGSIPLDTPNVRDELTRHLSEGWNAIVDREVDGKNSVPYQSDQSNPRYGRMLVCRRVARSIMLGSAPTASNQRVRGIEASRIRLGTVQPGETIANFNDALGTLQNSLAYLYSAGSRYWYDTQPTLRKIAEDRATQIAPSDVDYEIETRLHKLNKERPFAGIHKCPPSSLDVPDEQAVRLVILRPCDVYTQANQNNKAMTAIVDILNNRGTSPRIFRNMLAFVAPDQELTESLKQEVRRYLAWKSIKDNSGSDGLNLNAAQNKETDNNLARSSETVDARIKEAYCWLIMPRIDRETDIKTIIWDTIRISGGSDSIIAKAAKRMIQNEAVIPQWAPSLLLMYLNDILWSEKNDIQIKKLWEYLCTYCYLPRLADFSVLENAIRTGLDSTEYFAMAAAFDGNRYIDLKFNRQVDTIEPSACLLKINIAQKQLAEEAKQSQMQNEQEGKNIDLSGSEWSSDGTYPTSTESEKFDVLDSPTPETPKNRHFYMTAQLDNTRINRDVQRLMEEVISHLTTVDGAQAEILLEVNISAPNGIPSQFVRVVSENCLTLKVRDFGFNK
jgi:predicted AAA+ superfamily ATPase